MITVAQKLASTLVRLGIRHVFGVPSGNWVDYAEALRRTRGIEFILVSNEASAGFMADVYWRLTGNMAACFGTYGPGACNLSTGVCCGFLDRSPMIVLADEVSDSMLGRVTQMSIDQQTFFRPVSKLQTRLQPDQVGRILYKAYQTALSERPGPVYIGLPADVSTEEAAPETLPDLAEQQIPEPDQDPLSKMKQLFSKSRRPLLVLGLASIRKGIRSLVLDIAEKFSIPVIQTPMAKGMVPENHPCYAGVLAHALAHEVGRTHQQADLIVGIGYDPVEINYEEWMPPVPLVHIDFSRADIDRNKISPCCEVIGNVKHSLKHLAAIDTNPKEWDMNALARRRRNMFEQLEPAQGRFDPRTVLAELRRVLPGNGIMTCDVGAHLHLIGQQWPVPSPECQLMTNGCSSMGFGIPAAIAAKLACPDREVCCVVGDGGFLMMVGEMATAMRLGTKVIFVLMSDQELSLIHIKQEMKNYKPYGTRLHNEKPPSSNSFFGVPVFEAHDTRQYRAALEQAFAAGHPVIIEAFINKDDYKDLILKGNK